MVELSGLERDINREQGVPQSLSRSNIGFGGQIGRAFERAFFHEAARRGLPDKDRRYEATPSYELHDLLRTEAGAREGSAIRAILRARGVAL